MVACRISSQLKWYKNCKNRLRFAKVIVKNKMSRFLWFTVYIYCQSTQSVTCEQLRLNIQIILYQKLSTVFISTNGVRQSFRKTYMYTQTDRCHRNYASRVAKMMYSQEISHTKKTQFSRDDGTLNVTNLCMRWPSRPQNGDRIFDELALHCVLTVSSLY